MAASLWGRFGSAVNSPTALFSVCCSAMTKRNPIMAALFNDFIVGYSLTEVLFFPLLALAIWALLR